MAANKHELGAQQIIRLVEPANGFAAKRAAQPGTEGTPDVRSAPLPPGVAVAQGRVLLSEDWHLDLPSAFWRRREQGSLVLWRPGLTLWVDVADHDAESASAYVAQRLSGVPSRASELGWSTSERTSQLSFRLRAASAACPALQLLKAGPQSYVHAHAYFDREEEQAHARAILDTLVVAPPFGLKYSMAAVAQG